MITLKLTKYLFLLSFLISAANGTFAQDLVASKPGITVEELYARVNTLIGSMDEDNKVLLQKEAAVLAASANEEHLSLASTLYERVLGEPQRAKDIRARLLAQFPKGKIARMYEHGALFRSEDIAINELEEGHQIWLQKFPAANFGAEDQDIYTISDLYFAERYARAGLLDKSKESILKTKNTDYYVESVFKSYEALDSMQQQEFFSELEEAYTYSSKHLDNETASKKQAIAKRQFVGLSLPYAKALVARKQYEQALSVISNPVVAAAQEHEVSLRKTLMMGEIYQRIGRDKEAFALYELFLSKHGQDDQVLANAKRLYAKVQPTGIDFDQYITNLLAQNDTALYANYKSEMVKNVAPDFTLVDTEGKSVTLSDYKGKVVVLDFWATWCVPCIRSFPGMQAAVNKYASDPDVVFLFIDTWQREEDYQSVVKNFLADNPYTFHVLFDEMRDAAKSVATAYKLPGIPTKVIIDKDGFIRFQSAGSEAVVEKLVKELDVKIDLAKNG